MIHLIIFLVMAALFWIMTILCMKVDWILVNGVNMLPKEDRLKYKEKHDMRAMNKFIAKRIFMPLAIMSTVVAPVEFLNKEWIETAWFGAFLVIIIVAPLVLVFSALPKILGKTFEKSKD